LFLFIILLITIYKENIMKAYVSKAAVLVLSLMSVSAWASHWSYEGEGAPEHWGEIDSNFKACQTGMYQSPINIEQTLKAHILPLATHYSDGPVTLTNNGHTIQAGEKDGTKDTITLDNQAWTLQQFHFHAPAENMIHGKKFALEMHLVHKNAADEIAVVAVMQGERRTGQIVERHAAEGGAKYPPYYASGSE